MSPFTNPRFCITVISNNSTTSSIQQHVAANRAEVMGCRQSTVAEGMAKHISNNEKDPDLELPFLSHFLNLLIQRRSCFLGRKSQQQSCKRSPGEQRAPQLHLGSGLTLLRSCLSAAVQASSPPASASPNTNSALKSPRERSPRRLGPGARSSCGNTGEQGARPGRPGPAARACPTPPAHPRSRQIRSPRAPRPPRR